jgi:glutathione peroxidase-family protein
MFHGVQILLVNTYNTMGCQTSKWNLTLHHHAHRSLLLIPTMSECQLHPHYLLYNKISKNLPKWQGFLLGDSSSNQYLENYTQIKKEITTQDYSLKKK